MKTNPLLILTLFSLIFTSPLIAEESEAQKNQGKEITNPNKESNVSTQNPEEEDTLKPKEKTKKEPTEEEKREALKDASEKVSKILGIPITFDPELPVDKALNGYLTWCKGLRFPSGPTVNMLPDSTIQSIRQEMGLPSSLPDNAAKRIIGMKNLGSMVKHFYPGGVHFTSSMDSNLNMANDLASKRLIIKLPQ